MYSHLSDRVGPTDGMVKGKIEMWGFVATGEIGRLLVICNEHRTAPCAYSGKQPRILIWWNPGA
jgi:hypothetical protein